MKKFILILFLLLSGIALLTIHYNNHTKNPKYDSITLHFSSSSGLMNDGNMKICINGTLRNRGDNPVENVKITLIVMDEHDGILLMKPIKCQNHLSPNDSMEINSEYIIDAFPKTTIKTDRLKTEKTVKIKIEWIEDGVYKAKIIPSTSSLILCVNTIPNKDTNHNKTVFFENITSNTTNITYELIPRIKGDYEVIYIFKENGNIISYGDKLFYNVSRQNPIIFNIPRHNLTVESSIEIYSLDGELLHNSKLRISPTSIR
jgi:hypothetical protein